MELLRTGRADIEVAELKELVAETLFPGNGPRDDPKEVTWAAYYERYALGKRTRSYRESCLYTIAKMRHLCEGFHSLRFGDITPAWLRDVDARLAASGMSVNTRNIHFKNIRTCLNRAIDEELTDNYPFRRFKIRPEATRKRNLPVGELRRLFGYGVEPYQEYYLDYSKLIFMLVGINAIDLFRLTAVENGRVEYRRAKTHKLYSVKVEAGGAGDNRPAPRETGAARRGGPLERPSRLCKELQYRAAKDRYGGAARAGRQQRNRAGVAGAYHVLGASHVGDGGVFYRHSKGYYFAGSRAFERVCGDGDLH